jgi:hypothetical protein
MNGARILSLLACDIVLLGEWLPAFQTINMPSSSGQKVSKMLQNIGNHSTNNTVSHPRRLQSSTRPLWEPKTSQMTGIKLNSVINPLTITRRIFQGSRTHTSSVHPW